MNIILPEDVKKIIETINDAGYEAYAVGGCVRDSLMGRTPHDWDITTSALPTDIKQLFRRTVDTGIKHGTVTVLMGDEQYEITTYRIDGEYQDGRHPVSVEFTGLLSEDLKRRDFTINAMAYHPEAGLVDLFGGREDLQAGIIRCVGSSLERFDEDALRMMRAIRFAAQFGFEIEEDTYDAIEELSGTLSKISSERIREEMVKLLESDNPDYFKLFYDTGLTKVFMPEFDKAMETAQNHPHHMFDVGKHILVSMENAPSNRIIRLTMLFHDIGKPDTLTVDADGITHFYGHNKVSSDMAREIMQRLKFDNASIDIVCRLVANHDRTIEASKPAVRRCLNKIGKDTFPLLMQVKVADINAQSLYMREEKLDHVDELTNIYGILMREGACTQISELAVSGKDIIAAGVGAGPHIGEILNAMLKDVLDNPEHNNKEYLMNKYAK